MQPSKWQLFTELLVQESPVPILLFNSHLKIIAANEKFSRILDVPLSQILNHAVDTFFPGLLNFGPDRGLMIKPPEKATFKSYSIGVEPALDKENHVLGGYLKFTPLPEAAYTVPSPNIPIDSYFQPDLNYKTLERLDKTSLADENLGATIFPTAINTAGIQQDLMHNLVENSDDGIAIFDDSANIIVWNKGMERDLGLNREAVLGKSFFDLFPQAKSKPQGKGILKVLTGKSFMLECIPYLTRPGYFNASFLPIKDQYQRVIGGISIVRDITKYLKLQEERTARNIFFRNKSLLAVWVTQIEERKRIAEKIHNSLGQLLYGFKMEFRQKSQVTDPEARQYLEALLDETIQETKTIAFELMPAMLEDFGLEATLEEMVQKYSNLSLTLTYHVNGLTDRLERNLEIMIYTVIQELTNNVIKHARASKARIYLEIEDNNITIKVIDNGIGFEKRKLMFALESTGLRTIKNSLKLFNGEINISSQIGKGTLITVQVPVT